MTNTAATSETPRCVWCGGLHANTTCPRIKRIEYHEHGAIKSIEFHELPNPDGQPVMYPWPIPGGN